MSTTSSFALGLGSGLALWYATKDKHTSTAPTSSSSSAAPATPSSPSTTPTAPRNCAVRIGPAGVTIDGARVDVTEAARRCAAADRASVTVAPNAPASTYAALMTALGPSSIAKVRNASGKAVATPGERDLSSIFTLVVLPEGIWGRTKRVRYFKADQPTTWEDARDRLRAANILDPDALSPNGAGAWRLVIDPDRFRADLAEPLPGITLRPRGASRGSKRYTREGRTILRDGEAILRLDRVDLGNERYAVSPYQADRLAERVVRLLNQHGAR